MNTLNKIVVKENKILKLNNVLIRKLESNEFININQITYMMESYVKSKSNILIGPFINYTSSTTSEKEELKLIFTFMVQTKNPINNIDKPYEFKPQMRIINCLYARFTGKEENLRYAYSKLNLYAFENNIKLDGSTYTVFVNKNGSEIMADVFMETKNEK